MVTGGQKGVRQRKNSPLLTFILEIGGVRSVKFEGKHHKYK